MTAQDTVQLIPVTVDGVTHLEDQHGRRVVGVRKLIVETSIDNWVVFVAEGLCYRDGKPYTGWQGWGKR